jgi:hypothetical protein
MIIEEISSFEEENKPTNPNMSPNSTTTTTTTKVFWSAGELHGTLNHELSDHKDISLSSSGDKEGVNPSTDPRATTNNSADYDNEDDENNYRGSNLSKQEYEAMQHVGILDAYLKSNKAKRSAAAARYNSDPNSATTVEDGDSDRTKWSKCEQQNWRFKITFFIIYTIFTITNFILIYNMYNYFALVLEIVNLSVTYLLLLVVL